MHLIYYYKLDTHYIDARVHSGARQYIKIGWTSPLDRWLSYSMSHTSSTINRRWKTKTKCVDDNPTVAGSIVDYGSHFFWRPDSVHIYEGCGMRIRNRWGRQDSRYNDYIMYHEKHFLRWCTWIDQHQISLVGYNCRITIHIIKYTIQLLNPHGWI